MKVHMLGALLAAGLFLAGSSAQARWGDHWVRHHVSDLNSDALSSDVQPQGQPRLLSGEEQLRQSQVAAANPQVQQIATKLFCYCGCDKEDGHSSLMDCYKTGHLANCKTCQGEFIRAAQMNAQGASLAQIQDNIDREFARAYPGAPSPTLKRYLAGKEHPQM